MFFQYIFSLKVLTWPFQDNFIVMCLYSCTSNVLWCQVHSSHILANHKTLNYNSKHWGKKSLRNRVNLFPLMFVLIDIICHVEYFVMLNAKVLFDGEINVF